MASPVVELTSKCFQNGVSVKKWGDMCRLLRESRPTATLDFESDLSNSILILFGSYPADLVLLSYIKQALHSGLLSLPIFVSNFLQAAKSPSLQDTSTFDVLCRLIQEEHFSSGLPPNSSLVRFDDPTTTILATVQDSLTLLRTSYALPTSSFHNLTTSASELAMLLLSCVGDMSQVSTGQAMMHYAEVLDILQTLRLNGDIRAVLETFALSLSMILGDDAKMAQEAQMMQTLQLSLGKGDILGPNSQSDLITCSLLLRHLAGNRTAIFGSGNTPMAVASLVSAFRWTSWSPKTFYTQLFLSALSILAQGSSHHNTAFLWRSFIITRLTALMTHFEQVLSSEPMVDSDWRGATYAAFAAIQGRTDLLSQCDTSAVHKDLDDLSMDPSDSGPKATASPPFFRTFLHYCVHRTNLIDRNAATQLNPSVVSAFNTQLGIDSLDSRLSLDAYIDSRLIADANNEEPLLSFLHKATEDVPNHALFAMIIQKRFANLCKQYDVEGLGHLCKVFNLHEMALDIISLHVRITDILAHILAFVDEFDCESVGDPQTAVGHLGNVVLFLQSTLVRYQLGSQTITLGDRVLKTDYLFSTSTVFRVSQLSGEDISAIIAWPKALFDTNSEGIEDNILRMTKPKTLMKLAASLILHASIACADGRMEQDVLNNGVSYFTGPLLNWTLVGVIKALLRDIFERDFNAPVHLDVLQVLVQSSSCPQPVICLTAHGILSLLAEPRVQAIEHMIKNTSSVFDSAALRAIANRALGIVGDDPTDQGKTLTMGTQVLWVDQPRNTIRDAISAARAGKAPSLDLARCVAVAGPTRFITMLWDEISTAAQMGDLELGRRLATYTLLCPPVGRVPPLLPIFFGSVMHTLLARIDGQMPAEQTINIELLVAVITSALTGLLQLEWALRAVDTHGETRSPIGQPSVAVARRLAADLKRSTSPIAAMVMQRLSSSPSFVANFPMMAS